MEVLEIYRTVREWCGKQRGRWRENDEAAACSTHSITIVVDKWDDTIDIAAQDGSLTMTGQIRGAMVDGNSLLLDMDSASADVSNGR